MFYKGRIPFILFFLFSSSLSWGDQTTQVALPVTVTVIPACVLETPTPVSFGNYNPTAKEDDKAEGEVFLTCTKGTRYVIALDAGLSNNATVTTRKMRIVGVGDDELGYDLYQDASYTKNWGNKPDIDAYPQTTATGQSEKITVYGRIKPLQAVAAGFYSDQVTINLNF